MLYFEGEMMYNCSNKRKHAASADDTSARSNHKEDKFQMATSNHTSNLIPYQPQYADFSMSYDVTVYDIVQSQIEMLAVEITQLQSKVMELQSVLKALNPHSVNPKYTRHLIEKFWSSVNVLPNKDACWEWKHGVTTEGYGQMRVNRKIQSAHRISWELQNGNIPDGLVVLHSCDNRRCVNPFHLSVGTHADNIRDMDRKGRRGKKKQVA